MVLASETDGRPAALARAGIGGHDQYDVAEIGLASIVVGQGAVVHHLQQQIEDIRVGLFDFIEEHDGMRMFGDRLGQQATLIETDITGGGANQPGDRVTLHVLGHVEAQQFDAQHLGQLPAYLGLAHARGSREQETADGFLQFAQTRPGQFDGGRQ